MHVAGLADKNHDAERAQHADRQVDVEDPAPAVILGQPAAERRPHDRPEHRADAEHRHRVPWRSGGLMRNRVACDSGISPAPAIPCNARKITSWPRLVAMPHSAEATVKAITEAIKMCLMPKRPASQPVSGIMIAAQTIYGGQRPGDLVLRGGQAALDMRQRNVEDRVVDALHDVGEHDRERDHAAMRHRRLPGRLLPHPSPGALRCRPRATILRALRTRVPHLAPRA